MQQFESPAPIPVDFPYTRPVPMNTLLFRGGSYPELGFRLAKERAGEAACLSVVYAGCSNGAEVDSGLGIQAASGSRQEITVRAFDINPDAVRRARRGHYTVQGNDYEQPPEEQLKKFGFTTAYEQYGRFVPRFRLHADATALRQNHTVEFIEHDVTEPLPVPEPADLVFANNLLYHDAVREVPILRNLGSILSDRGILSLGAGTFAYDSPLSTERLVGLLDKEFGLKPIFTDSKDTPVMFART